MNETTPLTEDIGFLLARSAAHLGRGTNDVLKPFGLRVRQYSVLALASDTAGGLTQRGLAVALGLDPSQVVILVDELAEAGLVTREPSPVDRRARLVVATSVGRELRWRAARAVGQAVRDLLADLTDDERRHLQQLLARIIGEPLGHAG